MVTGGDTGTVEFDAASGVYSEVQPGSYLFMDGDSGGLTRRDESRWRQRLFVLSTIMGASRPAGGVCDVDLKGLAVDSGLPRSVHWLNASDQQTLTYIAANDEHGMLEAKLAPHGDTSALRGTRIRLPPGHCDPTVNPK
ncbi:hypothetical protein [Burkholderia sp. 8Y]|uniref:hypothetical protein n=1 Tax=Burkholderia sp. 8Y TaxID=2653133 RepID=UPI001F263CDD|nr:hypothetical protein [Burkholderia sp. 8Y]